MATLAANASLQLGLSAIRLHSFASFPIWCIMALQSKPDSASLLCLSSGGVYMAGYLQARLSFIGLPPFHLDLLLPFAFRWLLSSDLLWWLLSSEFGRGRPFSAVLMTTSWPEPVAGENGLIWERPLSAVLTPACSVPLESSGFPYGGPNSSLWTGSR